MSFPRSTARQYGVALRAMAVFTAVLGVGYTAVITGIGQLVLPAHANGSLVQVGGAPVGSSLIGQSFTDADGAALPQWFQSRPSAAGAGYDAAASSGSNLGPENPDLVAAIAERKDAIVALEGVDAADIPADALTASASGLDPHISSAYAELQVPRIARERALSEQVLRDVIAAHSQGPDLGFLGDPTVNVLELNIRLAELSS